MNTGEKKKHVLGFTVVILFIFILGISAKISLIGCSKGEEGTGTASTGSDAATPVASSGEEADNNVSMTKTSITSPQGGTVTITFTFQNPLSNNATPVANVTSANNSTVITPSCRLNDSRIQYVCDVTGIESCKNLVDYTVSLSGNEVPNYTTTFNSADDEFESNATFGSSETPSKNKCWMGPSTAGIPVDGTAATYHKTVENGSLKLFIDNPGSDHGALEYYKEFPSGHDLSAATLIKQRAQPSGSGDALALLHVYSRLNESNRMIINQLFAGRMDTVNGWWLGSLYEMVKSTGALAATLENTPLYFCVSKYNNNVKAYVSLDGKSYVPLTEQNMQCEKCGTKTVSDFVNKTVSGDNPLGISLDVESYNGVNGPFSADFDYMRFRSSGLSGAASDCPAM